MPLRICIAVMLLVAGCSKPPAVSRPPRLPFLSDDVEVVEVGKVGSYVSVALMTPDRSRVVYVKDTPPCRALAQPGAELALRRIGMGRFELGDAYCDVVGTESLRELRDSLPRERESGRPRANARWTEVERTDEVLLLRGVFPMVRVLRWSGDDVTAVVANDEACNAIAKRSGSFMTYEVSREPLFELIAAELRCPIRGFVVTHG